MTNRFSRDSQVPAGVLDAGMASLATFASGLTGVNLLSDTNRGVYGIFFTAFILGAVLVGHLIYVPSQVVAVGQELPLRLTAIRRTIRLAFVPSVLASSVALVAATQTLGITTRSTVVALTVTVAIVIPVSAAQDYVRGLLHIAENSWRAAAISGFQLVGVAVAIPLLIRSSVDRAWIPFGSLAIANIFSLSIGLLLTGAYRRPTWVTPLDFRLLATSGKWLVLRAAIPATAAFVAANVLTSIVGPVTFGHAEAARQVARPVAVLAMGLGAVLGPRAIRAGLRVDRSAARRTRRKYTYAIAFATVAYIGVAGFEWSLNPMIWLVPSAYAVPWLVAATVFADAIAAMGLLLSNELIGGGRTRQLAAVAALSSPVLLVAALAAGTLGAFARPVGLMAQGVAMLVGANWWLRRHYADPPQDDVSPASLPEEGA